ncbi:MAG: acyl-CoA dehydrogenase family protein [Tetrasphaera sp.]
MQQIERFTERHEELADRLDDYLDEHVMPEVEGWEAAGTMPLRAIVRDFGAHGFLGGRFDRAQGGGGGDIWDHVVLAEALASVPSGGFGMALTVHNDMVAPMLATHGSELARAVHLSPALRGDLVLAHAVSEADAGSDVAAVATLAERTPRGYLLRGTKTLVVNGNEAGAYAVLARLPDARPPFGFVMLSVARDLPGVVVGEPANTIGVGTASVTSEVRFEDVLVPEDFRLGGHGMGLVVQLRQFEEERIISAVRACATARDLLEIGYAWIDSRYVDGRPLRSRQTVAHRFAELHVGVRAITELTYRAVDAWIAGETLNVWSPAVKLKSSRLVRDVADAVSHAFGAAAQMTGHPAGRARRDARLYSISTGSDEMMLTAIARAALGVAA